MHCRWCCSGASAVARTAAAAPGPTAATAAGGAPEGGHAAAAVPCRPRPPSAGWASFSCCAPLLRLHALRSECSDARQSPGGPALPLQGSVDINELQLDIRLPAVASPSGLIYCRSVEMQFSACDSGTKMCHLMSDSHAWPTYFVTMSSLADASQLRWAA